MKADRARLSVVECAEVPGVRGTYYEHSGPSGQAAWAFFKLSYFIRYRSGISEYIRTSEGSRAKTVVFHTLVQFPAPSLRTIISEAEDLTPLASAGTCIYSQTHYQK